MDWMIKIVGTAMVGLVIYTILKSTRVEFASVISICVCILLLLLLSDDIQPVSDLLLRLRQLSGLDDSVTSVMLKATGICILTEIAATVCDEGGSAAIAKTVRFAGRFTLVVLSVPLLNTLLSLVEMLTEEL